MWNRISSRVRSTVQYRCNWPANDKHACAGQINLFKCTSLWTRYVPQATHKKNFQLFYAQLLCTTPAHQILKRVIAVKSRYQPDAVWRRAPGRPRNYWIMQIGNGSPPSIRREWKKAQDHGHHGESSGLTKIWWDMMGQLKHSNHIPYPCMKPKASPNSTPNPNPRSAISDFLVGYFCDSSHSTSLKKIWGKWL